MKLCLNITLNIYYKRRTRIDKNRDLFAERNFPEQDSISTKDLDKPSERDKRFSHLFKAPIVRRVDRIRVAFLQ